MADAPEQAPFEDPEAAENVIDLTPFLRRSAERQGGVDLTCAETDRSDPSHIDDQLKVMFEDSAETPISAKLAALLAELGVDPDTPIGTPKESRDD